MTLSEIIDRLHLQPHPEGGFYREVYRDGLLTESGALTTIYFALEGGKPSRWHRVLGSAEVWAYHAGAPVLLKTASRLHEPIEAAETRLGLNINEGEVPQFIVPPDVWQMAETTGEWSLVTCVVAPAFSFERFEMAPS
jgi:hypothetical protein